MADYMLQYTNPLTDPYQAIDNSGIDYSAYDKNNYLYDFLQDLWGYTFGGDSNWGDSQYVDNRQKAEDYAKNVIDGNSGVYGNLNENDYIVADNIRKMYDVDEDKGLEFLTGAMDWVGNKAYDAATQSDESRQILTNLMQGNNDNIYLTDKDGNPVHYTLGQDIYNALLNGSDEDYQYVDNVLRTIGSDLSKSGKKIGDLVKDDSFNNVLLYYDGTLGKSNGEYDKNLEALNSGGEGSTIVEGNRNGSSNGLLFTENGKYNALAGNSNAANALDAIDIAATALPVVGQAGKIAKGGNLIGKGVTLATKGAKGAKSAAKGAKSAEAAAGAAKGAESAASAAAPVTNAVDAANAARGSMAANNAAAAAANAARTTTPASGGITANAANLASNGPRVIDFEKAREAQAAAKGAQATKGAEVANEAASAAPAVAEAAQATQAAASTVPAAAEAANDSRIMQNIGSLADSAKGRVNDFRLNRDIRKAQKDFAKAQKQGSKAKDTEAANDTLDYSKFNNDTAQRLMGDIATGKTPKLNTDEEKATWAILQSQAPRARSRVLSNAKNVGKFMTNPKNIYLGNSVSDIVSTPIEELRRGTYQNPSPKGQGVIQFRPVDKSLYREVETGELYPGW